MGTNDELAAAGFCGQLAQEIVTLVAELRKRKTEMDSEIAELEAAGGHETWQLKRLKREEDELKMVVLDATQRLLALKLELENKKAKLHAKE